MTGRRKEVLSDSYRTSHRDHNAVCLVRNAEVRCPKFVVCVIESLLSRVVVVLLVGTESKLLYKDVPSQRLALFLTQSPHY